MNDISQAIVSQFNVRVYDEGVARIKRCLSMLNDEQIWSSSSEELNSVGNLILHLCGNVVQWIGTGVGDMPDVRVRKAEFLRESRYPRKDLINKLDALKPLTDIAFSELTDELLLDRRSVQGFQERVLGIIIHVIEHFSYHVGQIAYITKQMTDSQLGFYDHHKLDIVG